jgi:hypothetical protein
LLTTHISLLLKMQCLESRLNPFEGQYVFQKVLQDQNSWIQEDNTQAERVSYAYLLSNAVVWLVVDVCLSLLF